MLRIRRERRSDVSDIRRVNESAFNGPAEACLVELLRDANKAIVSLVATLDDKVVGHIMFSPITIESNPKRAGGLGLAPLAVLPKHQGRGIGTNLVTRGVQECKKEGYDILVVLGAERFYTRFGFRRASIYNLKNEYNADENFMALELKVDALRSVSGLVKYESEFKEAGA
jgi:putative acetyltransferase